MNAEICIVEASPKLKHLRNNLTDIISIYFITDNYSIKKEDAEKAIINKEKIIIPLKETKNKSIKCSLIRNNNIIGKGEFVPVEGLKWYTLKENKNNTSLESLITSSTSNANIKSGENLKNKKNNNMNSNTLYNYPDYSNTCYNNYNNKNFSSKNFLNKINNCSISSIIKIKLSIKLSYNQEKNTINTNYYDIIKNNNYTKEPTINSSKDDELFFNKKDDIFLEEDLTIVNKDINNTANRKNKMNTTNSKRHKHFAKHSFPSRILFSKNKININQNQIIFKPNNINNINSNHNYFMNSINSKTIAISSNNSKAMSPRIPKLKNSIINAKRLFNEDKRMKTSNGFYIPKKEEEKENEKLKIITYDNIEDEILDQNYKDHLKNDEILKVNISRNYSFTQNNTYNNSKANININEDLNKNINYIYTENKNLVPSSSRPNKYDFNNKGVLRNIFPTDITYSLDNYFSIVNNTNYDEHDNDKPNKLFFKKSNKIKDIILTDTYKNFETLKKEFFLLYPSNYSNKIKDNDGLLEIQLIIDNTLALQNKHQKEYIKLLKLVNANKNIINNYQKQYISLVKKMNKLQTKKLSQNIIDSKKDLYNEDINNFIKVRKKIISTGEIVLWKKMIENTSSVSLNSNKDKLINIFTKICDKNENNLNILSMKFYKELRNKNKNFNKNPFLKQHNNINLSPKNIIKNKKNTELEISTNMETNKDSHNYNTSNHSKDKSRQKNYKDSEIKLNINLNNQNNINNNRCNNFINKSISSGNNNNNILKINKCKKKSSSINSKIFDKKSNNKKK